MTTLQWYPAERLCSAGRERLRLVQASWFPHRFTQIVRPEERAMRWPLGACTTDEEASDRCGGAGAQSLWPEIVTEDHVLTVKWGIRAPLENVTYLFRERPCGRLSRSETVNVPVEASQAEAKLAWGVLTVSSLKLERAKPKTPEITAEQTTAIGPAVDAVVPNFGTYLPGGCLISNVSRTSTPCIGERSGMG